MEAKDREAILKLLEANGELKRLWDEHEHLEQRLNGFDSRPFLTVDEEVEEKRLKLRKLHGVDRMMEIVTNCRDNYEQASI